MKPILDILVSVLRPLNLTLLQRRICESKKCRVFNFRKYIKGLLLVYRVEFPKNNYLSLLLKYT